MSKISSLVIMLCVALLFSQKAEAATLFFTPGTGEFEIGKEITVDLKIDSDGVGVNAGQATIRYPKEMLTVKSVSKTDSAFNFWLEEPTFTNEDGAVYFVGGTPYGVSGASIQTLQIIFETKSVGLATVSIVDGAVTSSDGSGANVLSRTKDATFTISPTKVPSVITPPTATIVSPPTQIVRKIEPAEGLPKSPTLIVPLYPDPILWYNHQDVFTASWKLTPDISNVATAINKQPNFSPERSEGLFDSKIFEPLKDGVSYLHVRFRNNNGWGATTHYRLAIDTKTPVPFETTISEGEVSDNPSPTFIFKSSDALSDIKEYLIKVDDSEKVFVSAKDFSGSYKIAIQKPGQHHIIVSAIDNAGNSIESNSLDYVILPLPKPSFTFVTEKLLSNESSGLAFRGTAIPNTEVLFFLKKVDAVITERVLKTNERGEWEFIFSEPLRNGAYVASIQNRDSRGAVSDIVLSSGISVVGKYTNIIILTFVLLIGALLGGYWYQKKRRERTALRVELAERDATNVFNMIKNDVQKLEEAQKTSTKVDEEFITSKLKKNVEKMSSYIKDEIARAKD